LHADPRASVVSASLITASVICLGADIFGRAEAQPSIAAVVLSTGWLTAGGVILAYNEKF